jgi:glycosyltransferase involved in cell wall biosynthesis
MKIGIDVTPILYEGTGVGEYTQQLIGELLRQNPNDEFVLFFSTLRGYGKIKRLLRHYGPRKDKVRVFGLPLPPALWQVVWNKLNILKIEWLIGKVDVFHCWDYLIPPSDCKRIVTIHDITPILYPETHTAKINNNFKLVINKIKKEKVQVLTDSESSKQDLIKYADVNENLIDVVYLGSEKRNKNLDSGKKLMINDVEIGKKYILSVGTREPRKNLKCVIEAFNLIAKKYSGIELVIAGKYGWGDQELTNQQIYKPRIKILGFVKQEDLVRLYKNAICLVYPSLYEGFGLPVLDAMSLGCPVITSNVSSLPEVGGDAVLYVDPKYTEDIKNSMIRIIESNELREELINKGLEQVKKFSWEKCARETRKVYEKVRSK